MVNAAHASDSPESARRELRIVDMKEENIRCWVDKYYGNTFSRILARCGGIPKASSKLKRKMRMLWRRKRD